MKKTFIVAALIAANLLLAGCASDGEVTNASTSSADYSGITLGNSEFIYKASGEAPEALKLADFIKAEGDYAVITSCADIDLNGDGGNEYVLRIDNPAGDSGGYLVLHKAGGEVYGFRFDSRMFWDLKTDGTFSYSEAAGTEDGVASISFEDGGYSVNKLICAKGEQFQFKSFIIDGKEVLPEEYDKAIEQQSNKPNAEWTEVLNGRADNNVITSESPETTSAVTTEEETILPADTVPPIADVNAEPPELTPIKTEPDELERLLEGSKSSSEYYLKPEDIKPLNPDEMSPEEIFRQAQKVYFKCYCREFSQDFSVYMIKGNQTLYRVDDPLLSSKEAIYETLGSCFSDELIEMAFLDESYPYLYIADDGTVWAPAYGAMGSGYFIPEFSVVEKTDTRVIYLQRLYYRPPTHNDEHRSFSHENVFIIEKIDGQWKFTTFPSFFC